MINETLWHDERSTYRAVTGVMSTFPNAEGTIERFVMPTKGTVPLARTFSGTIESDGVNVRGTDTAFFGDGIKIGDYLYDGDGAVRKIKEIITEELMVVEYPFPSDISAASPVLVCERQTFKMITWQNVGSGIGVLQEVLIAVGERAMNGGAPVAYDATASNAQIAFTVSQ